MFAVARLAPLWPISRHAIKPNWYWLYLCGGLALMLYALCKVWCPSVVRVAEGVALLSGVILFLASPGLRSSRWCVLLGVCMLLQLAVWGSAMLTHPEWSSHAPTLDRLGKLFLFLPLAVLMAGQRRNVLVCWGLFMLGLVLVVVTYPGGLAYWRGALAGARVDFDIRNAQHTAMYFGVALLMLTLLAKHWLLTTQGLRLWRLVPWTLALLISLLMIYVTQTRAIVLGLLLSLVVLALTVAGVKWRRGRLSKKIVVAAGILLLLLLPLVGKVVEVVKVRMQSEAQTSQLILQGRWHEVPYSSIGIRVQTWLVALERIQERPLLGWGNKARSEVIRQSTTLPDEIKREFGHLHNYFLETQLSYGLAGSLFLLCFFAYLAQAVYRAWRAGILEDEWALFALGFFIYWLFINNFESYLSFNSGVFTFGLVAGGLLTRVLNGSAGQASAVPVRSSAAVTAAG